MLARGLERVFVVVYALIAITTVGNLLLQDSPGAPQYWAAIYLVGALSPLAALPWVRRQFALAPTTTFLAGLLTLWVWSFDASHGRFDFTLFTAPILFAAAWAIRGFSRKETQDGSV